LKKPQEKVITLGNKIKCANAIMYMWNHNCTTENIKS